MSTPSVLIARNWKDLIRPKAITVDDSSVTRHYAKFVCEPLERGFGLTLGNALRRVLLSSLQGTAIRWSGFRTVSPSTRLMSRA